ncbi:MAG: peptidoglycan-binding protein [Candidatus Staskawiczbacteria bacterium]|nr:peptidoglycan-binding protein [Candidatus Staskawiczbacteria bacterium]
MSFAKKLPTLSQWKQFFRVLRKKEKITFFILSCLALASLIFLSFSFYINITKAVPASGSLFAEGIIGQPRFINPVYGETNDVDRALIGIIYSGLMTYDENGKIVKDLVKDYKISNDGKIYEFILKDNLFWHDGKQLSADDIIFTIKTIQNSDYKSPLMANWIDVDMEKTSGRSLKFYLKNSYNSFLENATLKIIPKHIWEDIPPESFTISYYNLQPIGAGPYAFEGLEQTNTGFIKNIHLKANPKYYNKVPYISDISFKFFENKEELIKAANQKIIDGFGLGYLDENSADAERVRQGWSQNERFKSYFLSLPRYFAVFLNSNSGQQKTTGANIFSDENIRKALNYSVNKEDLAKKINSSGLHEISIVNSPILPDFFNFGQPSLKYEFNSEKAKELLDKAGFKDDGAGQRAKINEKKPAFQFKAYLKANSKGKEVTELQGCLSRTDNSFKELLAGETIGNYGKGTENAVTEFQKKYLPSEDPTGETGKMTRQKLNEICVVPQQNSQPLKFTLTTINQPQMVKTAEILKEHWQKIGFSVEIETKEVSEIKSVIKERNYNALLYGEALGGLPDLYPFWHSSQVNDPGLNLSGFQSKDADQLLKEARETTEEEIKKEKYEKLQNTIIEKSPAVFLYNNDFVYIVSEKVKGIETAKIIDPAKRFSNISDWYIKTKRVLK